ncbi:MAG: HDOD domain-containing protein [Steroidobacteraceae bacterium]|jgi:HD-like signal output (HDOD) protein
MSDRRGVAFVNKLVRDMSQGGLEIACFPEVATKLVRSLDSDFVTVPSIARMIESEPALSVRVIGMANSAAFQGGGRAITDARSAVVRIGLRSLRAVILAFAVSSLRDRRELKLVQGRVGEVWQRSVTLATFSHVLAMRVRGVDSEGALLGALMQGVGRIFLFTEAAFDKEFRDDIEGLDDIVEQWHVGALGKILEQWGFGHTIIEAAIEFHGDGSRSSLADVLKTAELFLDHQQNPDELKLRLNDFQPAVRLGLTHLEPKEVLETVKRDASVGTALG